MHSRLWTLLGVLRTVAIVILSALISYSFGHSLGTTETNARIFGAVSVAAVGVRAVLALRISAHWDEGRWGGAVIGIAMFALLVAYAADLETRGAEGSRQTTQARPAVAG